MKILKHTVITVIAILFAVACKKNENNKNASTNIEFNVVTVADSTENYVSDSTISNVIKINYYEAKSNNTQDSVADNINNDFYTWISSFLFVEENYAVTKDNINDATASEIKRFLKDIYEDESLADCETCRQAEFSIDTCGLYQTDKIISIVYSHYSYSGGAHGYYGITTFNYNRQTAEAITIDNLSTDIDELTAIAEKIFIQQNGDVKNFMFEDDKFYLPNIFYFTEKGIVFYYSIYEIASYAEGDITIELDYNQIKNLIEYVN
jgi:hypothetical protein